MADLVPLVTLDDPFAARVLVARLGADGILCQLRGAMDGPYPLGPVVVLVEADRADEASQLLLVAEAEEAVDEMERRRRRPMGARALAAVAVLILALLVVRLFWFVV
ncbi:MAG: hypothetical protein AAGA99_20480 [Actinomycetota bacterium]